MNMRDRLIYRHLHYIIVLVILLPLRVWTQDVEVKSNFFYIDGEKFFVKGIGYEPGATPGEVPWNRTFDSEIMHFDIQRILSAGFNTIRTWSPLTAQELDLLQQYNIKIIMGIWVDPHGNFSDEAFVNDAKAIVTDVLSYSKNYKNIIAYLIMNEPQPEAIFNAGYENTVALWSELIEIIHNQHPNRPASIANTSNGTYIESDIFDFSAYNVYIYNPVTVNYLHRYRDFTHYLQKLNQPDVPLIITEYGLSVSPTGEGNWGYGGNTLAEQQDGIIHMYKSMVDGGAAGSCVFIYSDGWWKGGNEFAHDDVAEEWFGFVEYSSLDDNKGQERPIWGAVKGFQSAIITQPQNSEIYPTKIPIEIFINDTINRIDIILDNSLVYQWQSGNNYLMDTLLLDIQEMKDATLIFNCYDTLNNLIKSEEKNLLIAIEQMTLPSIQIDIENNDFWKDGFVKVNYTIDKSTILITDSNLDYIYYPHVGFSYGESFQTSMPDGEQVNYSSQHNISNNVDVFTLGAAFDVTYNSFQKRIVNELTLIRSNEATNLVDNHLSAITAIEISPNPIRDFFIVALDKTVSSPHFDYVIYNNIGVVVKHGVRTEWSQPIDISALTSGVYYMRVRNHGHPTFPIKKIIKL